MDLSLLLSIISLCFGSGVVLTLGRFLYNRQREADSKMEALQLGVQALLRNKMIEMYYEARDKGFADINARSSFQNLWDQYHKLGKNGVMDNIKDKFLKLDVIDDDDDK